MYMYMYMYDADEPPVHTVQVPAQGAKVVRAGFGGSTSRVSREGSCRGGVALAQEAAGTHPMVSIHPPLTSEVNGLFRAQRSALASACGLGGSSPVFVTQK